MSLGPTDPVEPDDPADLPSSPAVGTQGLGQRAARGAAVTLGGQVGRIILQLTSVVVLSRLLTPTEYGLVAMVLVVAGFAEIFRDFGLSSAAVQASTLTRGQRDNLLWINGAIGIVLASILFLAAPLVAAVYHNDSLVSLTRVMSTLFIVNGFATQYRASLNRSLRFRSLALIDVTSPAIALVLAVVLALAGWGYWALALQQIGQAAVTLVLLAAASRWLPGRYDRTQQMGGLIRFGWNLVATQMVNYVANNADAFTIGIRFGSAPLGLYNRGFQLVFNPVNQIRTPVSTVAIPVLSRLQDDQRRYNDFVCRGQVALGYTLVAGLGIVISGSVPLTRILLGAKWYDVAPILSLLALGAVFQTLAYVGYWVYVSRGVTAALFRYSVAFVPIKILCVVVGSHWGVVGVAAGYALSHGLEWPVSLWWLSRSTDIDTRRLVYGALRLSSLVAIGAVLGFLTVRGLAGLGLGPLVQVLGDVVITVGVYAVAALVSTTVRRDITDLVEIVQLLRRRRAASA